MKKIIVILFFLRLIYPSYSQLPNFNTAPELDLGEVYSPKAFAVADLNSDNYPDFLVSTGSHIIIYLRASDNSYIKYKTIITNSFVSKINVADMDKDGILDIITLNSEYYPNTISLLYGSDNLTFSKVVQFKTDHQGGALLINDFNNDSYWDIAFINEDYYQSALYIYLNDKNRGYYPFSKNITGDFSELGITADLNNDNITDIITASASGESLTIFIGQGNGAFNSGVVFSDSIKYRIHAIAKGDFNNDKKVDLAITMYAKLLILIGDGKGGFVIETTYDIIGHAISILNTDINHDSIDDLVIVNCESNNLGANSLSYFKGVGNGHFIKDGYFKSGFYPVDAAVSDLNTDRKNDIAVLNKDNGSISLYYSIYDSIHYAMDTEIGAGPIIHGDFNNDKNIDIATEVFGSYEVNVKFGDGKGNFSDKAIYPTLGWGSRIVAGDIDDDSLDDIVIYSSELNGLRILYSNGDKTFTQEPYLSGLVSTHEDLIIDDFNNDGINDIAKKKDYNLEIINGIGNRNFDFDIDGSYDFGKAVYGVVSGDLNNDSFSDIVVTTSGDSLSVFLGKGDGTFQNPINYKGGYGQGNVELALMNSDNIPDIVLSGTSRFSILTGKGDGTFNPFVEPDFLENTYFSQILCYDFNNDNKVDILTDRGTIFFNQGNISDFIPENYKDNSRYGAYFTVADVNNDHLPDMIFAESNYFVSVVLQNHLSRKMILEVNNPYITDTLKNIVFQPSIPFAVNLVFPLDKSTSISTTPSFKWYPDKYAQSYELQISTDSAFTNIIASISNIKDTTYDANQLSIGTNYWWRVRGMNQNGLGQYSSWNFQTAAIASLIDNKDSYLSSLKLAPNPVSDNLTISFNTIDQQDNCLELFLKDSKGKVIQNLTVDVPSLNCGISINCQDLSSGIYYVVIQTSNQAYINKFAVCR